MLFVCRLYRDTRCTSDGWQVLLRETVWSHGMSVRGSIPVPIPVLNASGLMPFHVAICCFRRLISPAPLRTEGQLLLAALFSVLPTLQQPVRPLFFFALATASQLLFRVTGAVAVGSDFTPWSLRRLHQLWPFVQ